MALTKRGKYWHYDFVYKKRRFQGSTDQTNINKARLVQSKIRSDVALGHFGIEQSKDAPLFKDFLEKRFTEFVERHSKAKGTAKMYADKVKRLLSFTPWAGLRLSEINEAWIEKYSDYRLRSVDVITLNGDLRTLRRALSLAHEWQLIQRKPKVRTLPGEKAREFVVSAELEKAYLSVAEYPLREAAILILDLGLRPEECVKLKKQDISGDTLTVRDGKSVNAARALPLTQRAIASIELLCALWPDSDYLFPGRKGKHFTRGALDNLHTALRVRLIAEVIRVAGAAVSPKDGIDVNGLGMPADAKDFVLYSFRHTFGTKLADCGANPFQIKTLMGHQDIRMSQRYIHPSGEGLELAMKRKELFDRTLRGEGVPADSTAPVRKSPV